LNHFINRTSGSICIAVATLTVGFQSLANPVININDTTGPITVTGAGFASFNSGSIGGNSEAVWWYATGNNLGFGTTSGIWKDPGSSKISDEYYVVSLGTVTYGIFLSDPSTVPSSFLIPGTLLPVNLSSVFGSQSVVEPQGAANISPTSGLNVWATSSVPDAGSTLLLLASGIGVLLWCARGFSNSLRKR